jgi:hypothetical protein
LDDDVPGPAKEASQTASHAVCCRNPSIIRGRPEPIILSLLPGTYDLRSLLSQFDRIIQWTQPQPIRSSGYQGITESGCVNRLSGANSVRFFDLISWFPDNHLLIT